MCDTNLQDSVIILKSQHCLFGLFLFVTVLGNSNLLKLEKQYDPQGS